MNATELCAFVVYGTPRPQGSKRAVLPRGSKRPVLIEQTDKHTKTWRGDVREAAQKVAPAEPIAHPCLLEVVFRFQRPKSHHVAGDPERPIKANAPVYYPSSPDLSKAIRALEDALTGLVWVDDRYIVRHETEQLYTDRKHPRPGASVRIYSLQAAIGDLPDAALRRGEPDT